MRRTPHPEPCRSVGCTALRSTNTYSPWCQSCRLRLARYGHPMQTSVTAYELAPYLRTVKACWSRNGDSRVWPVLHERWHRLVNHAATVAAEREAGKATFRPEAMACEMLLQVARTAPAERVIEVMLAVSLMHTMQPRRFKDQRAFAFILVRRLRHLAPMARASYWSQKEQRVMKVYREAPPKAAAILGQWLVDAFAAAGALIAESEARRVAAPAVERQALIAALQDLK
jgi:hypothetical protein